MTDAQLLQTLKKIKRLRDQINTLDDKSSTLRAELRVLIRNEVAPYFIPILKEGGML